MDFQMVSLQRPQNGCDVTQFGYNNAQKVSDFHKSFPEYQMTPLVSLKELAKNIGLSDIYVKDESYRFGLNAFKVLGSSFAIGSYIAKLLNTDINKMPYEKMASRIVQEALGEVTFVTATDGNHGRGVAWTANRLGQKSVVYMPIGSAIERLENILSLGAEASITDLNYDDTVRMASEYAKKYGWILVQDTDWAGYKEIPTWIMQGYTTMAWEVVQQLQKQKPTHIFLQAGVGAMSGAIAGFFADYYGDEKDAPIITIVEPSKADCLYRTAKANDGKLHFAKGRMDTIMAGLACGEPCLAGWQILHDHADHFISLPDHAAALGMRVLGNPLPGDKQVISGESGAATIGCIIEVMRRPELAEIKRMLSLDGNSRVLCFSTEGDTDQKNYRRIVWDGAYASR